MREVITLEITSWPERLRRSLVWVEEAKVAQQVWLGIDTGLVIYFYDPHCQWRRGMNENTNGLLRQSFPKRTWMGAHGPEGLMAVATMFNRR